MQNNQQQNGTNIVVQGRIVWGSVKATQKKVYKSNDLAIDPKTGQPIIEYKFGLAIPKVHSQSSQHEINNFQAFWNAVHQEAAKMGVQQGDQRFHWKYVDGDGKKEDGSPYPDHSKGHYVLACSSRIPLKLMAWENGKCVQVTEEDIKCGDYVQVAINIAPHGNPNAGLYVNPSFVARVAYGQAIVNVDPIAVLGATPPPIPQGGSATPIGGGFIPGPGFGAGPAPTGFNAPMPQAQQQPIQPNYGVLPGQFQPQQAQQQQHAWQNGQPNAMPAMPGMAQATQQQPVHNYGQPNTAFQQSQMPGQPVGPSGMVNQTQQQSNGYNPQFQTNPMGQWNPPTQG